MPAVSLVVSICAALVVYDVFAAASCAGVTFRFDDAHPVGQWRDVAETFNVRGLKATFAVNPAYLNSRGQVEFLRDAARGGHEIVDHTHSHAILSYVCRNKDEFDALKGDSSVAEAAPSKFRLNLRYDIDFGHPLNWRFRGKVTNGVLVVSSSVAKRLHRPDKVYSPSLFRRAGRTRGAADVLDYRQGGSPRRRRRGVRLRELQGFQVSARRAALPGAPCSFSVSAARTARPDRRGAAPHPHACDAPQAGQVLVYQLDHRRTPRRWNGRDGRRGGGGGDAQGRAGGALYGGKR